MKTKFVYTGIRVRELETAVQFYTGLLGMREVSRDNIESAHGTVVNLESEEGGQKLEINYYEKGSQFDTEYSPGEGLDHLAFEVEDLEDALTQAANAGHPTVLEIKGKNGKWAYIQDPDGNYIELME